MFTVQGPCTKCALGFKLEVIPCGNGFAIGVKGMCRVSAPFSSEEEAVAALSGDFDLYFIKDIASMHCNGLGGLSFRLCA